MEKDDPTLIERYLEDPLAEEILKNAFEGKNYVAIKMADGEILFVPSIRAESPDVPEVSVNST